jgi:S-adenosylmethionine:tRNA ribosyltransferase-isomerase
MFGIKDISIQGFSYPLPDEQIATYPLSDRDQSRLLFWNNGKISDNRFYQLPDLLPNDSLMVFNNTRVIRARIFFRKKTGARIEIFCLEPCNPGEYVQSFLQTKKCSWKCIVGNLKKWKGEILVHSLEIGGKKINFNAEKIKDLNGCFEILFSWDCPDFTFADLLEATGNIPIPPYLNRESEEIDLISYQTVYSKIKGSVAAPTAGLHFTPGVFSGLLEKNIRCEEVTLHVGAGTFQPVKSETIGGHEMHTEHFIVSHRFIELLAGFEGNIIAVGTTSVRTLESLYYIGRKILTTPKIDLNQLAVDQWIPYDHNPIACSKNEAFKALANYLHDHQLTEFSSSTQIIIVPGYRFQVINGMVTNFHQPQSTLLLLIAAFLGGDEWKRIYNHALKENYRFLSYGDSNLYLK